MNRACTIAAAVVCLLGFRVFGETAKVRTDPKVFFGKANWINVSNLNQELRFQSESGQEFLIKGSDLILAKLENSLNSRLQITKGRISENALIVEAFIDRGKSDLHAWESRWARAEEERREKERRREQERERNAYWICDGFCQTKKITLHANDRGVFQRETNGPKQYMVGRSLPGGTATEACLVVKLRCQGIFEENLRWQVKPR